MSELKVEGELSLDGSGWEKSLRQAQEQTAEFADHQLEHLKGAIAGAFAVGAIESLIESTISFGHEISQTAVRLNISTDAAQQFAFAFKRGGLEIGDMATKMDKLAVAMETALGGGAAGDKMAEVFERLGVSLADLNAGTPETVFKKLAAEMDHTNVTAQTTADVVKVFGRGAGALIPIMKELGETSENTPIISKLNLDLMKEAHERGETWWATLKKLAAMEIGGAEAIISGKFGRAIGEQLRPGDREARIQDEMRGDAAEAQARAIAESVASEHARLTFTPIADASVDPKQELADIRQAQELQKQNAEAADRAAFERLSKEEKITKLVADQAHLRDVMAENDEGGNTQSFLNHELAQQALIKNQSELAALRKTAPLKTNAGSDSLVKVGNFLGDTGRISSIGERTNQLLSEMLEVLHKIGGGLGSAGLGDIFPLNMGKQIILGYPGAVEQRIRFRWNARSGASTIRTWKGPKKSILGLLPQLRGAGYDYEHGPSGGAQYQVEASLSYSFDGSSPNDPSNFVNTWELVPNMVEKDLLRSDIVYVNAISDAQKALLKTSIESNNAAATDPIGPNNATLTDAHALALWPYMKKGETSFPLFLSSIRHTVTVSSLYTLQIAWSNVGRIITTASLTSIEGMPGTVLFGMPLNPASGDANLFYGWMKSGPGATFAAGSKAQLTQEYHFGLWNTLVLGAAL